MGPPSAAPPRFRSGAGQAAIARDRGLGSGPGLVQAHDRHGGPSRSRSRSKQSPSARSGARLSRPPRHGRTRPGRIRRRSGTGWSRSGEGRADTSGTSIRSSLHATCSWSSSRSGSCAWPGAGEEGPPRWCRSGLAGRDVLAGRKKWSPSLAPKGFSPATHSTLRSSSSASSTPLVRSRRNLLQFGGCRVRRHPSHRILWRSIPTETLPRMANLVHFRDLGEQEHSANYPAESPPLGCGSVLRRTSQVSFTFHCAAGRRRRSVLACDRHRRRERSQCDRRDANRGQRHRIR